MIGWWVVQWFGQWIVIPIWRSRADDVVGVEAQCYAHDIVDATTVSLPLDDLTQEMTTRGAFVRLMNERIEKSEGAERQRLEGARLYGLQAFENQEVRRRADRAD